MVESLLVIVKKCFKRNDFFHTHFFFPRHYTFFYVLDYDWCEIISTQCLITLHLKGFIVSGDRIFIR